MGLTLCGKEIVPHKAGPIRQQSAVQWHSRCRNPVRAVELRRKQTCNNQHGTVCMVAAVDAPEAQKEKHEQPQAAQGPSTKHVRREEAILFQGDETARPPCAESHACKSGSCTVQLSCRNLCGLGCYHKLECCSGFGWDSCKVGDWWNVVKSKIQDMKVWI